MSTLAGGEVTGGFHGDVRRATLKESQRAADRAIGRRHGLVELHYRADGPSRLPKIPTYFASGPLRHHGQSLPHPPAGVGVAASQDYARLTSISEAVERYASMVPPPEGSLIRAPFTALRDHAIDPTQFALLSARQYGRFPWLEPLSHTKVVDWCWAFSLTSKRRSLIPAALVYFGIRAPEVNNFVPELTSTGTASHITMTEAILAGLHEVIERDAVAIAWLSRLPLRPLLIHNTELEDLVAGMLAGTDLHVNLYEVPTDSSHPVLLAIGGRIDSPPSVVVGASCRADYWAAARKAVYEVAQLSHRFHDRTPPCPQLVRTLEDHADLYGSSVGYAVLARALRFGPARAPEAMRAGAIGSCSAELNHLVDHMAGCGLEVLVVDLTPPDVACSGYRVVRVVVPSAIDMNIDGRFPRLGGRRIYDLPVGLGFTQRSPLERELNRLPIPLA